jgi:hypothetical protein
MLDNETKLGPYEILSPLGATCRHIDITTSSQALTPRATGGRPRVPRSACPPVLV